MTSREKNAHTHTQKYLQKSLKIPFCQRGPILAKTACWSELASDARDVLFVCLAGDLDLMRDFGGSEQTVGDGLIEK